jgi:hypothetical protein
MADSLENKGSLAERLEEDRQQVAIRVSELKREYNVTDRLKESVQKNPWEYIIGGVLIGFLLYCLPGGKLEVAQQIADHESPRTTKLYDRRQDEISLDEIERITI